MLACIQHGDSVILGLNFPNVTTPDDFDKFFASFGLPWKQGDYHSVNFQYNPSSTLPAGTANSFPDAYSMKALHIKNARPKERIFVPVPGTKTQSMVFPPSPVDETQAAVAAAKIGKGFLIYRGDFNEDEGTKQFIVSLCV